MMGEDVTFTSSESHQSILVLPLDIPSNTTGSLFGSLDEHVALLVKVPPSNRHTAKAANSFFVLKPAAFWLTTDWRQRAAAFFHHSPLYQQAIRQRCRIAACINAYLWANAVVSHVHLVRQQSQRECVCVCV